MADRRFELYDADDILTPSDTAFQDLLTITVPYGEAVYVVTRLLFTAGNTGAANKNGAGTAHSFLIADSAGPNTFLLDAYSAFDEVLQNLAWGNQAQIVYTEDGVLRLQVRWTGTGTDNVRFIARCEVVRNPGP